jgi:putative membrane protein insertion efficiency factor
LRENGAVPRKIFRVIETKFFLMTQVAKFLVLHALRAYKGTCSPLLSPACRYVPTCSEYAMEAVERFGVLRGGCMAVRRVLRCHPFAGSGYDPVVNSCSEDLAGPGALARPALTPTER